MNKKYHITEKQMQELFDQHDNFIFDLYGTVIDISSNEHKTYLWKKMADIYAVYGAVYPWKELKKRFWELDKQYRVELGVAEPEIKLEEVFERLFIEKNVQVNETIIFDVANFFRVISRDYMRLFDGLADFLHALREKGKKVFLLSNAQRIFTWPELEILGLPVMFDGIYISSDKGIKKPNPDFLNGLCEEYGLDQSRSIMFGNEVRSDIAVARACQMDSMFVYSGEYGGHPAKGESTYTMDASEYALLARFLMKDCAR